MKKLVYFLVFIMPALCLPAQSLVDEQVKSIKKEFEWINLNLDDFIKNEINYTNENAYWDNTHYTAYINSNHELVRLNFSVGEEGYWSQHEYYFKHGKIFFIYIYSGEPDGSEKQVRIYFWDNTIIHALLKQKLSDEPRSITDIPNKRFDAVMDNVTMETYRYLESVENELKKYYEAFGR